MDADQRLARERERIVIHDLDNGLARDFVDRMLVGAHTSSELHQAITEAVAWISTHPTATQYIPIEEGPLP